MTSSSDPVRVFLDGIRDRQAKARYDDRLDPAERGNWNDYCEFIAAAPATIAALAGMVEAVLALHLRHTWRGKRWQRLRYALAHEPIAYDNAFCPHCRRAWPCPTVAAVAAHVDTLENR